MLLVTSKVARLAVPFFSPLHRSGLPQQRKHRQQRLENPQHCEEQVVCVHGQNA